MFSSRNTTMKIRITKASIAANPAIIKEIFLPKNFSVYLETKLKILGRSPKKKAISAPPNITTPAIAKVKRKYPPNERFLKENKYIIPRKMRSPVTIPRQEMSFLLFIV